jgi:hypothetical protein
MAKPHAALSILRALDANGSLNDRQKGWIETIEQRIIRGQFRRSRALIALLRSSGGPWP